MCVYCVCCVYVCTKDGGGGECFFLLFFFFILTPQTKSASNRDENDEEEEGRGKGGESEGKKEIEKKKMTTGKLWSMGERKEKVKEEGEGPKIQGLGRDTWGKQTQKQNKMNKKQAIMYTITNPLLNTIRTQS